MREVEGANQLHKSNTEFNTKIVECIDNAKRAKTLRDLIDIMSGSKHWDNVEDRIYWELPKEYIEYFVKPSNLDSVNEQSIDGNNKEEIMEEDER